MKKLGCLIVTLLIISIVYGQSSVTYTYDDCGNRLSRNFSVLRLAETQDSLEYNVEEKYGISVYPNPVGVNLNISINEITEETTAILEIYDATGKFIYSAAQKERDAQIYMNNYKSGIYFLKISINKKEVVPKLVEKT